jgi:uncharacterized protein YjbJ (UPF0337 family)
VPSRYLGELNTNRSSNVNWDRIEGNWKQFKGSAKEQWGNLTDDDLSIVEGKRDQLAGRIQERYGVGKDEAERQINQWLGSEPEPRERDVA